MKKCGSWEGCHSESGKERARSSPSEKEGTAQTMCDGLNPKPHYYFPYTAEGKEVEKNQE